MSFFLGGVFYGVFLPRGVFYGVFLPRGVFYGVFLHRGSILRGLPSPEEYFTVSSFLGGVFYDV